MSHGPEIEAALRLAKHKNRLVTIACWPTGEANWCYETEPVDLNCDILAQINSRLPESQRVSPLDDLAAALVEAANSRHIYLRQYDDGSGSAVRATAELDAAFAAAYMGGSRVGAWSRKEDASAAIKPPTREEALEALGRLPQWNPESASDVATVRRYLEAGGSRP